MTKISGLNGHWAIALLLPTVAVAQVQKYFTNEVNERAVSCPRDPNQIGYKHVTDVVVDQETELERIQRGEAPRTPYVFPFCNQFKYLMEQEVLQVLLDDVTFVCGYNGTNEELCVFEGNGEGDVQVQVPPGSSGKNIVFEGISFFGFNGTSVAAHGAGDSKITFNDAAWKNFVDDSIAIHQELPTGGVPMQVEVNKATFENGTGSNLFENVGGILSFDDMTIIETIRVDSMIRTSNGGTSTLAKVDAAFSDLTRLTHTMGGSKQTVSEVKVHEMTSMGSILYVEGAGSQLDATAIEVYENKLFQAYEEGTSRNFNVLIATDQSTANIKTVDVADNEGVDRIFSANDGATVYVTDATVTKNIGTQPPDLLSNIAMSEDGGSMNVLRLTASEVEAFSAAWFAICGSFIQVKQSCVMGGQMAAPAFISSDSTFISEGNYMDTTNMNVARCINDPAASVFSETDDSSECFSETGTGACNGQCKAGFTESTECLAYTGDGAYTLSPQPAPAGGGQGNPSCPASPPTPIPTLPPKPGGPGGAQGGPGSENQPAFTATIPPGQFGPEPGPSGGGPSGSGPNGGGSSNNGNGGTIFEADPNAGSGAFPLQSWSQILWIGSAIVVAKLVHQLIV